MASKWQRWKVLAKNLMKIPLSILGLGALLATVGCVENGRRYHEGRGGAEIRFYGETPERHERVDYYDGYHHRHPYDRDHYWDNDHR
jgi:hypothetical protein